MLADKVKTTREKVEEQIHSLQERATGQAVAVATVRQIQQAIQDEQCPVCIQPLDEMTIKRLEKIVASRSMSEEVEDSEELPRLLQIRQLLRSFSPIDVTNAVQSITETIDQYIMDKASKQDRISEIHDYLRDIDQSEIRKVRIEYSDLLREMLLLEEGIKNGAQKIRENEEAIRRIQKELDKEAGTDLAKERLKREMYSNLSDLFNESVKVYRERLRDKLEKDATELFRKLTSEQDYIGLKINESYGLIILHKDGRTIPVRSAGAEHIVALSLIGALHRNAPLSGPIIMESPFGRLDETHTTKVVEALPAMADQVILLVFESELRPQVARNLLLGNLRAEYKMIRQTARYTTLEKNME